MLASNLISALKVLNSSEKPSLATDRPVSTLEPGQKIEGTVLSKISDGLFKVQVAGQNLQMRLSGDIRIGGAVKLEVLTVKPGVTFSQLASTSPLSTAEVIGSTARLLSNLTEHSLEKPVVQQLGSKPVFEAEQIGQDTQLLAAELRDALGKSGLFYESHQAQWVRGERSIAQLREEPQNILLGKTSADAAPFVQQDAAQPIARELIHLVQQQLHTLEQHHLVWTGQVWPGQQMQWEIQGQPERQSGQTEDQRQWSTEMELALPGLGDIHARLVFSKSGLRLNLRAADEATSALFTRALPDLKNALSDAGIALASAAVDKS